MAIVQPPVTGDVVQDSWALQVTRLINSGAIGTGGAGTGVGGGSGTGPAGVDGFNTASLYLFTRTTANTAPTGVGEVLIYDYEAATLEDTDGNAAPFSDGTNNIWYDFVPTEDQITGEYIWTTVVYIADQDSSETIPASSWSSPALLARPGMDAVTVTVEARAADGNAMWDTLTNTVATSPNFKNDTAKVIGLVVRIYEAGIEVDASVYTDSDTTYVWTKNGLDFTPNETQVTGTGKDMRVLLINEMDVAEGNINEVFTCVIDY